MGLIVTELYSANEQTLVEMHDRMLQNQQRLKEENLTLSFDEKRNLEKRILKAKDRLKYENNQG